MSKQYKAVRVAFPGVCVSCQQRDIDISGVRVGVPVAHHTHRRVRAVGRDISRMLVSRARKIQGNRIEKSIGETDIDASLTWLGNEFIEHLFPT